MLSAADSKSSATNKSPASLASVEDVHLCVLMAPSLQARAHALSWLPLNISTVALPNSPPVSASLRMRWQALRSFLLLLLIHLSMILSMPWVPSPSLTMASLVSLVLPVAQRSVFLFLFLFLWLRPSISHLPLYSPVPSPCYTTDPG